MIDSVHFYLFITQMSFLFVINFKFHFQAIWEIWSFLYQFGIIFHRSWCKYDYIFLFDCLEISWLRELNWTELFTVVCLIFSTFEHIQSHCETYFSALFENQIREWKRYGTICLDWFPFFLRFAANLSFTMCNRLNISYDPMPNSGAHRTSHITHLCVCTMLAFSFGWFFETVIFFFISCSSVPLTSLFEVWCVPMEAE